MFYRVNESVPRYRSSLLENIPHGFSTRHGGVSECEHTKSMNLAFNRGDDDATVIKNFEIFARAVGADPKRGVMLGQIHSCDIMTVTENEHGLGIYTKSDISLDGFVTNTPGTLLCVRVADCVPILFADSDAGVIGAVHSGWRGSVGKISVNCIKRMCELGAVRENIRASVGPCICKDCYEVGEDFVAECENRLGHRLCAEFIEEQNGKPHADLKRLNYLVLREAGLSENNIDVSTLCTCCAPDEFFSHRYHKDKRGTMCAMIALEA